MATWLIKIAVGKHCRDETHRVPQVQGPLGEVKPLCPALGCIALLGEVTVQRELGELEVANNGYCSNPRS